MSFNVKDIEDTLNELALLGELLGENSFKTRAYSNAARKIASLPADLEILKNTPGIGKGILHIIEQIFAKKPVAELLEYRSKVPKGVVDFLKIEGLGPKRARILWQDLGISSLGELLYACNENRLTSLKGFGKSLQAKIAASAQNTLSSFGQMRLDQALQLSENLINELTKLIKPKKIICVGALNRKEEVISKITFALLTTQNALEVKNLLEKNFEEICFSKETSSLTFNYKNTAIELFLTNQENSFGLFCLLLNGDENFLTKIKTLAAQKKVDLNLNEHFLTEQAVFDALDIYYVEPEQRHEKGILIGKGKALPKFIGLSDLKGAFHNHTLESDGQNTLLEMKKAAQALGLSYLSINDHSKSAFYANGLLEDRLSIQLEEIKKLNEIDKTFYIFSGTEADILKDGQLDYDNDFLAKLDIIVASVHMRFKQDYEETTQRLLKALSNPFVTIFGHPTGRLILSRKPSLYAMEKVIKKAQENMIALELNANPHRLDLNEEHLVMAKEAGAMICINADAHSTKGLSDLQYGVMIAKRAGLTVENVLNCQTAAEIKSWLKAKKLRG